MAIVFALISFFGWGIGETLQAVTVRRLGTWSTTFWGYAIGFLYSSLFAPFFLQDLQNMTLPIFLFAAVLGILIFIGFIAFNESVRTTNVALVGAISSSFSGIVVLLSLLFLRESLSFMQGISVAIILGGLFVSIMNTKDLKQQKVRLNRGILLALFAMLCWGISYTFIKIPVRHIGFFWPIYINVCLFPLMFLYAKVRGIKIEKPIHKKGLLPLIFYSVFVGSAEYSYGFAIKRGLVSVVSPISGAYPVLFVILAFLIFKDKITRQQIAGIVVTLTGIVLLSIFSV